MAPDGIAVPTTDSIDDPEQLEAVLGAVIETAENIVAHELDQREGHNPDEQTDLSPLFDLETDDFRTLAKLDSALSALDPEGDWQHDDWEPGEPCPECGAEHISVIEPREYYYTYNDQGGVVDSTYGDVSGPAMNHWCVECDTQLSRHPATALFWIS